EAALDGRDQWLVATDPEATVAARETYEDLEGRVNVIRINGNRGVGFQPAQYPYQHGLEAHATQRYDWNQHPQGIRFAVDLVKYEPADEPVALHLLGKTIVVDTLADAVTLQQTGPAGWRYVTKAGEVIEADGTLRAGPLTAAMGLLSRRSELEAISLQIADVDHRIESLTAELSQGNESAKALEEQIGELRNTIYQSNTSKVELTSQIAQVDDRQIALKREQPVLERELQVLFDQVGKL